ncbi:MAG TPA: tetratricopeptide repeat protein [Thermoanaerobaculia bacterium]|nr:tetratricopeptide repeat protein [Thermoanaerobaculia bacterium]
MSPLAQQNEQRDQSWRAGAYHLARGDHQRALALLSGAISDQSTDGSALNMRGLAEMMSNRLDKALQTFERALSVEPELLEARFNRGVVLLKLRQYDRASAEFEVVFRRGGLLTAPAAFHRAIAEEGSGRLESSVQWLDRALAADPAFDPALLYLGSIRERQAELQAAGRAYRRYLDRHPDSIVALLRFGIVAHAAGHPETARKYLRQVLEKAPESPEAVEANKFLVMWE